MAIQKISDLGMRTDENDRCAEATPRAHLLGNLMNPNYPKNEMEWCASDEITRLRAMVDKQINDYNQLGIMFKLACDALNKQGIKITIEGKSIIDYFNQPTVEAMKDE